MRSAPSVKQTGHPSNATRVASPTCVYFFGGSVTLIVTEYDEKTPNAPFCGRRFDFVGLTVAEAVTKARTMEGFPNLKGKVYVNRTALHIDSPQVLEAGDTLTLLDP